MNDEAFPHDSALPQLAVAADGLRMREVFGQHLQPHLGRAEEVRDCRLTRVRCRRGHRCLLQYVLRFAEVGSDREWEQCVTGSLYADPGRARHLYQKQLRRIVSAMLPEGLQPFLFLPELKMFVQLFPYDRRLPALPQLLAGPPMDIQSSLLQGLGSGGWRIEEQSAKTIRYRAGLGATLRYDLGLKNPNTGETRSQSFYLKNYSDERGAQTFELLRDLGKDLARISPQLDTVQPVAYSARSRALLLDAAPGVPLEQLLMAGCDPPVIQEIARALAALNRSDFVCARLHTREDEIANLQHAAARLQWASPHLGPQIERIVQAVAAGWVEMPPAPVHRDLKTDHVLLDRDRVVLIDLDSFAMAHPLLDPAQFLARLATLPFRLPVPVHHARTAAQMFAKEYFARVPRVWREPLAIYYAGAVLDAAQGFFGRQEPNWHATVDALVQEAIASLDGKVW